MKKPFWFKIVEQWKVMGKGHYGVTFPFLVGAIARTDNREISREFVANIFNTIINELR